jgi:hypothetical protein
MNTMKYKETKGVSHLDARKLLADGCENILKFHVCWVTTL